MRFLRPFRDIGFKFIAYLMFLSVIPLLVLGISSYQISRGIVQAEAQRHTLQLLRNQRDYLELHLDQVEALIANISGVEAILEVLNTPPAQHDPYTHLATQARIGYILNNYLNLKGLLSIDFFTPGGDRYHVGDTLDVGNIDSAAMERLFQTVLHSGRLVFWAGLERNINLKSRHRQVVVAAKMLQRVNRETLAREPVALLLINYSADYLYDQFRRIDLGENAYIRLIDQQNRLIYHPDRTLIGSVITTAPGCASTAGETSRSDFIGDEPHTISYVSIARNGWCLEGIIPNRTLAAKAAPIQYNTLVILLACFGLVALAAVLYSHRVVQPVRAIIDRFKLLQDNRVDLGNRLAVRSHDEIGELTRWFNTFLETLAAQRASERALRDSEERYSLAMRGANDGLWDWEIQQQAIYLSPRFKDMLGYAEDELGTDPTEWFSRIHPADRNHFNTALAAHFDGAAAYFECEYRLLHKDNRYIWVLGRGLVVRDEAHKPYRMAGSNTDIDSRKRAEEQLRHHALHDALTGLPNRAAFIEYLRHAIERYRRRSDCAYAVLFLDLDHFKNINDTQGHSAGDALLMEVSRRLHAVIRAADTLARLGGDEFVLLIEDIDDATDATATAERLLQALEQPVVLNERVTVSVSASIGITIGSSAYETPEQLLRDADIAMYRAKALGKARYELFDTGMRDRIVHRLALETELKRAMERGEFRLWYQPIMDLKSGHLHGFEALMRWQHPERGLLSPGEFMQVLEDTGLIMPLGIWVLEEACRQLVIWRRSHSAAASLKVSVNLSAKQFQQDSFVHQATEILAESGIPATALALEVTETALIQDMKDAAAMLEQMETLGFEIHMDDFGTGYSSLSYLDLFKVDAIKIDRSFVSKISNSTRRPQLIKTLIALAREMRIEVIAEGIENAEQLTYLTTHGCHYGQGYYLCRPLDPESAESLLKALLPLEAAHAGRAAG